MNPSHQKREMDILEGQLAALNRVGPAQFSYTPVKGKRQEHVWRLPGNGQGQPGDVVYATPSDRQVWIVGVGAKPILPADAASGEVTCLEDALNGEASVALNRLTPEVLKDFWHNYRGVSWQTISLHPNYY
ncbi:hypothetical protein HYU18_02595 [Candidatus Woesearchaeota archaeon]|nr:hypothetical protein [Candidatus Woesearchaeota archaeon]